MEMGVRIKELRKKKGMTQTDLAKKLGVTKGTVSTWETGSRTPSFDALDTMGEMFEVSFDYLLGRADVDDYHKLTENEMDALAMADVEEYITEYAMKYARLDDYGKRTVESVIQCEFNRCREGASLADSNVYKGAILFNREK